MEKIHFETFIDAPVEKVWDTMLGAETYGKWTAPFNPGGRFEGDWSEGSTIRFIGPDPEGGDEEGGMLARIAENRPHEFISIEHVGIIKNGVEDTESEEVKKWTPAFENYTFTSEDGGTKVEIDMDINEEYKEMFEEMWPKALAELKALAEAN